MQNYIKNHTFDEIKIGDTATLRHTLTNKDIQLFAVVSGDLNPAHVDKDYATHDYFHKIIAHGMWTGSLISSVIGMELPGPGAIYLSQSFQFLKPVALGDTITACVTVLSKDEKKKHIDLDCVCTNQDGQKVIQGLAKVLAPVEKVKRKVVHLPKVELKDEQSPHHNQIVQLAKGLKPLTTGVIQPVDRVSLKGAIDSDKAGLIKAILIGPERTIKEIAKQERINIAGIPIVDVPNGLAAAKKAVQLVHEGKTEAIMKGAIHTDELLHPILDHGTGLQIGKRVSHVSFIDTPDYPRPLFLTDAAINIFPTLSEKVGIVQNAIDLYHAFGRGMPRVALLSAVETVHEKIPSTLDATAICKMAERGQINGGLLDGPLAFDNALSEEAAKIKHIHSQVAGKADILVVPDVESGNMVLKQFILMSKATMAGIVMGTKVPVILTSRSSDSMARKASCALAVLYARRQLNKGDA